MMRSNAFVLGSAAVITLMLGACGTIVDGGSQTVDVIVKGSANAYCNFSTSRFKNAGTFPNKMTLERSRENLIADCQGEQNKHTKFEIPSVLTASGSLGNVATGVVPGVSYDAMTGGLWTYPDPIIVDFRANPLDKKTVAWPENTADAQVDSTKIGTAAIAAPSPVHMQPIMDDQLNPALPQSAAPKPEIIDAVRLATDKQVVTKVETTTTTTAAKMKPIVSPEDDPAVMKAKEEAKAKAAAEAKRKAAAKKKAEEDAKAQKAAKEAAEAKAAADKAATEAAEAAKAAQDAAAPTTTPAPAPAAEPSAETLPEDTTATPPAGEPAPTSLMAPPTSGQSVDKKEYLEGQ